MFNMFPGMFNNMLSVVNDRGLIDNIVDSILSNDNFQSMIESVDNMHNLELELKEYKDVFLVEGKLPGINKKDIDIDYLDDKLIIKVKRNQVFSNGYNTMIGIYQPNNDYTRIFYVPGIDAFKIKAVYTSEVLQIYLPKTTNIKQADSANGIIDVDYTMK